MDFAKGKTFEKMGRRIAKRKYAVILAWLLILVLVVPFVLDTSGVISLQLNSASDKNLESARASDIISEQFSTTVADNTLMIVVSSQDVSSLETQAFINRLTSDIKANGSISGLESVNSVYSVLVPILNQTNQGVYIAIDNANLTFNLLYGVPTAYMTVWGTAYNQTLDSLVSGINQTNQGVYEAFENANLTYNLLYGVPATYLNVWSEAYNQTQSIPLSNELAYNQTAAILYQADPATFETYTAPLLDAFNASWTQSFQNPETEQYPPVQRALVASEQTNQLYITVFLAGDESAQTFTTALTSAFSLQTFLTNTQAENSAQLEDFAIDYVASYSNSSVEFVAAAYDLGRTPDPSALKTLSADIIWNPQTYNMNEDFLTLLNSVAYEESAAVLRQADPASFDQYTVHLLDAFNASWSESFQNTQTLNYTLMQRAQAVSEQANTLYIDTYLGDNKDFGESLIRTFSLEDFLSASPEQINQKLSDFAVSYVSNSSGLSLQLIDSICDLGREYSSEALQTLAGNIVCNPSAYNLGEQLNSALSSLVSPAGDVTLVSVSLSDSSETPLLVIRDIITAELAKDSGGVTSALVTGESALSQDFGSSATQDFDFILPVTIALLLIATGLFFRSIVTPLVTLGAIGVGLGISQIFIVIIGTYVNQVDFMIPTILLTVLIGVGTDYSIFIIARHREELVNGLSVKDAVIKSVTWAGESIATSGTTVIISFLGLAATTIVLLQTLGLIVGASVIVALAVSLTLVPSLAMVLKETLFWPNCGSRFSSYAEKCRMKAQKKNGYFARSGKFSVKHGKVLILVAILVTVPLFYIYASTTPTFNFLGGASKDLESISASNSLSASFGAGQIFPTYVVVNFSQPLINNGVFNATELAVLQSLSSDLSAHDAIKEVTGPTMPYGIPIDLNSLTSESNDYSAVLQNVGADNKTAIITLKFEIDPYSTQAINAASDIRESIHQNYDGENGVSGIYVGGTTGTMLDVKNVFDNQFNTILPIVVVGVAVVLFVLLGSLLLPICAVLSVLMSIVWTLAATIIVFQSAFNYGLLFITPMILLVLLLGIGMDYNIFILARVREEAAKGQKLNDAIVHAIEQTGGIITAAAIILAGSLGALMLSSNLLLRELGFAFAFSILIDALVVRTYLVPAVMSVLGKYNWYNPLPWPKRSKELYQKKD
ncbi:MAG: MMPL family transporter [Candidatus Bathyarchaeota archaeon]|nr:MMPL family transporter [Candidatus Bathyarchaeota archaeon]